MEYWPVRAIRAPILTGGVSEIATCAKSTWYNSRTKNELNDLIEQNNISTTEHLVSPY
jgi:hypothetical protein